MNGFFVILMLAAMNFSCTAQPDKNAGTDQVSRADDVAVYYFHYTRRCVTCQAVETVSGEAVKELFGDRVPFLEINLDEKAGKDKAKELGISSQALLIVHGDRKINLTNEGFLNAQ